MKLLSAVLAAGGLALSMGAAHATVFGGTSSFTDGAGSSNVSFTALNIDNPFATGNLTAGTASNTYSNPDFATIQGTDTGGGGFFGQSYSDPISLDLNFTQPGSGSDDQSGTGTVTTDAFLGIVDGYNGELTWTGDTHYDAALNDNYAQTTVNFADGAQALVDIYDTDLAGSGNVRSGDVLVKIVDVKDPTPVPEPATLALLGAGLFGLGFIRRRRNNTAA